MRLIHFSFFLLLFTTINFAQNYGNWSTIGSLNEKRSESAGIVLEDGNILLAGKNASPNPVGSCEIFSLKENRWKYTTSLNIGRVLHTLVLLSDGRAMAIGGYTENSCEILDRDYSKWVITDSLKKTRLYGQTTTVLKDGRVLLVGGFTDYPSNPVSEVLGECEVYDPTKQVWNVTASLNTPRFNHKATLLNDGRLLVTGGSTLRDGFLSSCEMFDPSTNKWSKIASMNYVRANHSATLLPDGRVIVAGGRISKVELYDPIKDNWEVVGTTSLIIVDNLAYTINYGEYLFLLNEQMDPGWEVFSLKDFRSVFYRKFKRQMFGQVFLKLNEEKLILAGGREIIINGLPSTGSISFCQMYDFNLTGIKEEIMKISDQEPSITCYPNPFNPLLQLKIYLPKESQIKINIFDLLGREVIQLADGFYSQGTHTLFFNGSALTSGLYFVHFISDATVKTIKSVLLK